MIYRFPDKKKIFSKLPYFLQMPLVRAYCESKKKWAERLKTPVILIFFVTSRCNLRCSHCFFWQEINNAVDDELSIHEIRKISRSLEHPLFLSLTGGEPFLRKDMVEIISAFHEGCGIRDVGITTNGTLEKTIIETVASVFDEKLVSNLSIQVSLDGLGATHDGIRGVKGAFDKAFSTVKELRRIQKTYPRLNVKTCLSVEKQNISELNMATGRP